MSHNKLTTHIQEIADSLTQNINKIFKNNISEDRNLADNVFSLSKFLTFDWNFLNALFSLQKLQNAILIYETSISGHGNVPSSTKMYQKIIQAQPHKVTKTLQYV